MLNIGTLNAHTVEGMRIAGKQVRELGHPIVLDPVGAGASTLRTKTAIEFVDSLGVSVIRGNMSEVKAISGASASTRGVDANAADVVCEDNLGSACEFARSLSERTGAIVAITGAIDVIADAKRAFAVFNGSPIMSRITGAGCMLSCVCGVYAGAASGVLRSSDAEVAGELAGALDAAASQPALLDAIVAAVTQFGVAGEIASSRMLPQDGNGSFRTYLLDALFNMDAPTLERNARVQEVV